MRVSIIHLFTRLHLQTVVNLAFEAMQDYDLTYHHGC